MKKTEYEKNMEYMLKLLHDEWSRSGKPKTHIFISKNEADRAIPLLAAYLTDMKSYVDSEEVAFKDAVMYSKEAFVTLRIIKKFKKCYDKEKNTQLFVPVDKEELAKFKELFQNDDLDYCLVK